MKFERIFGDEPQSDPERKSPAHQDLHKFNYSDSSLEQKKRFRESTRLGRRTQAVLDQLFLARLDGSATQIATNEEKLAAIKKCIVRLGWSRDTNQPQIYNSGRHPSVELEKILQN